MSLHAEVKPFGIDTIHGRSGLFRTELLTEESANFATPSIDGYNDRRVQQTYFWKGYNGQQAGDPAKLTQALITIANEEHPQTYGINPEPDLSRG